MTNKIIILVLGITLVLEYSKTIFGQNNTNYELVNIIAGGLLGYLGAKQVGQNGNK